MRTTLTRRARGVLQADDRLDALQDDVIRRAVESIPRRPSDVSQVVDIILIAKHLERVGDHATNVAEGVILVAEARNVKHAGKLGRAF